MLSLFNDFIILPFQGIYSIFSNVFGLGIALIVFSVFISILTIPLMKWAQKQRLVELQYQTVLEPQIKGIKTNYKGQAKSDALSALYKRYSYNPLFAARQSMQALVQVPVLIIAYIALESYLPLKGSSFLCFKDLSVADNLLFGLPLLPFVMTIINMCTTYLSDFTKKEKTQGYLIAFAFLVILFFAPAALLIYWTSNNLINLLKTLFAKVHKGSKFNFVTLALATFTTLNPKYLLLPLSIFVPSAYVWSNNITFYGPSAIAFSSFVLVFTTIILYLLTKLVFTVINKISFKHISIFTNYGYLFVCAFIFAFCGRAVFEPYKSYFILIGLCVFIILSSIYIISKYNYKFLVHLYSFIFVVSLLQGLTNFENDYISSYKASIETDDSKYNDIILKNKPNIYFLLCESMNGPSTLKKFYNVDTSNFTDTLISDGFSEYDKIYANSYHTLGTLTTMMSLGREAYFDNTNLEANTSQRNLITGSKQNYLMRIFKNNGYTTKLYLDGNKYFGTKRGEYLDYYDGYNNDSFYSNIFYFINPFTEILKSSWRERFENVIGYILNIDSKKEETDTINIIEDQFKTKSPYVVFRRLNLLIHTNHLTYTYKQKQQWIKSQEYQNNLKAQFDEIIKVIKVIDKNDPNAVIILLGDHGSCITRGYPHKSNDNAKNHSEKLYNFAQKDGETLRSVADDIFHVFAAVRLPNGLQLEPNFSSVNVFLKIFALLNPSQKETIDKYILPNYSSFYLMSKDKITLIDGKLQDDKSWYYDPEKIVSWTELIQKMD